ncbi:hypothetical protein, unlikely [Trypanosoma brucei gambiense DAL972]|uniref:Uncharacterized protein n=1 Tax=Trypanosoma brucei gambiense (strain MHOM/CI/86/DAL972) TaxID=679716 RepID=D0A0N0_TRYB9|nr:hypothetical protein, unlikely [Trypanosoma brucei gambiense DAL972]CBH16788.1 hypothetical protein, unlikely [Trypanosoma brucei gambiense DAL972]|eukprot:XP_011779052.1 hypothetical protein, unlikely [Trypanosoma brucei gambiense DAL972]
MLPHGSTRRSEVFYCLLPPMRLVSLFVTNIVLPLSLISPFIYTVSVNQSTNRPSCGPTISQVVYEKVFLYACIWVSTSASLRQLKENHCFLNPSMCFFFVCSDTTRNK